MIRLFDVPASKTTVIHLGCDAFRVKPHDAPEPVAIPHAAQQTKPYLLYVGLRGAYKNFSSLLEAYATSKRLTEDFDLVAFGAGAFTQDEQIQITALVL